MILFAHSSRYNEVMNFSWKQATKPIVGLSGMDGVTDAAMRHVTAMYGPPDVIMTEFTSVEGLTHNAALLLRDLHYTPIQRPIIAQLYGSAPEAFRIGAVIVCALGFNGLDINMGCPSRAVTRHGCGAALIKVPQAAKAIIRAARAGIQDWCNGRRLDSLGLSAAFVQAAKSSPIYVGDGEARRPIPLSVKTRIGYDHVNTVDWVSHLLETSLDNISIHGRTLLQKYSGQANWDEIAKAANLIHQTETTVMGNGDLKTPEEIMARITQSGVDGVLIARAAMGNPWLFREYRAAKNDEAAPARITLVERLTAALEHVQCFDHLNQTVFKDDPFPFPNMRKHLGWYIRDLPGAAALRKELLLSASPTRARQLIQEFMDMAGAL